MLVERLHKYAFIFVLNAHQFSLQKFKCPLRFAVAGKLLSFILMGLCCSSIIKSGSSPQYEETKTSNNILYATLPSSRELEGEILESPNLRNFNYAELKAATKNFLPESLIAECGFGYVYKGYMNEHSSKSAAKSKTGLPIAIKLLQLHGSQGQQEWLAEIKYLGQLCHPNLVKLLGYCMEQDQRLLVYEFMPNDSLEMHLYARESQIQPFSWDLRMKIAIGTARGLAFLHNVAKVIHRDLKSSSILLDSDFNAKISGFGFAKDRPDGKSHVSTRILDTSVYAAPEYRDAGRVTTKSDVYSFGVILLELISGRPAAYNYQAGPNMDQNLVEWFLTNNGNFSKVVDVFLEGNYALNGARKAAIIATHCLSHSLANRPDMEEVIKAFEQM
ncbi:probable serine/threonine-protein kinase PBL10 [Mercurialis annua]|uniref:probable serine/threonine-protein kinase PBL10 n=1 Tax=Mercurialis annua TaxID=3986 RepID=UPI0024AFE212|nr:probable serine/threonine-protein kinase PBL10 [Mercurialis annua]